MSKRSKTGCITCRIRRVKCDEGVPHCMRCTSSGRVCDGYLDESSNFISRRQLTDRMKGLAVVGPASGVLRTSSPRTIPPAMSPQEYVFFDIFRSTTAVDADAFISSGFWSRNLLQLAHNNPAVWHATLALGALHQRWEQKSVPQKDETLRSAMRYYGKAMAQAASVDMPEVLLALSLTLVAAANMLGYWKDAHAHMLAGMQLLAGRTHKSSDTECIAQTLIRMDLQSMSFSDSSAPYPFDRTMSFRDIIPTTPQRSQALENYSQAATILSALLRRVVLADQAFSNGLINLVAHSAARQEVRQSLALFEQQIAQLESRQQSFDATISTSASIHVRIYHTWLKLFCKLPLSSSQLEYDRYLGYFERLVVLCHILLKQQHTEERVLLSLEPAVVLPLFDTVKRCRHPQLRRLALKLLQGMNRHEGMWRSDGAAVAGQVLIMVEEGVQEEKLRCTLDELGVSEAQEHAVLGVPWSAWSWPDFEPPSSYFWTGSESVLQHDRIKEVKVLSSFDQAQFRLRLIMDSSNIATSLEVVKDIDLSIH